MKEPVILEAVRTPFARRGGAFPRRAPRRPAGPHPQGPRRARRHRLETVEDVINGTVDRRAGR